MLAVPGEYIILSIDYNVFHGLILNDFYNVLTNASQIGGNLEAFSRRVIDPVMTRNKVALIRHK